MALSYPTRAGKLCLRYVKPRKAAARYPLPTVRVWSANLSFPDWGRVAAFAQNSEDLILPMPRVLTELFGFDQRQQKPKTPFSAS